MMEEPNIVTALGVAEVDTGTEGPSGEGMGHIIAAMGIARFGLGEELEWTGR